MKSVKVLMVCLGNICRSPTAHGIFEQKVVEAGLSHRIFVDSAGTSAWHIGEAPDPRALEAAQKRGYLLQHLRGRQVTADDFHNFDYIMAMDKQNLRELQKIKPADYSGHLGLFLAFSNADAEEVPDPYHGGNSGFETVLDLVEDAADGLLEHIRTQLLS